MLAASGLHARSRLVDLQRLAGQVRILERGDHASAAGLPLLFVPGVIAGGAVFASLVARLVDVLDGLGVDQANLVTASQGGCRCR